MLANMNKYKKHLPELSFIILFIGSICWINDFYYTFRTLWQMITGRYPYEFLGTLIFLLFTFFTFIGITLTRPVYWLKLSFNWQHIIGLEMLANLIYITWHLPSDMWTAPNVELAHFYAFIDVCLITYCEIIIVRAFYE